MFRLKRIIARLDEKLVAHFEANDVEFLQFAFRWCVPYCLCPSTLMAWHPQTIAGMASTNYCFPFVRAFLCLSLCPSSSLSLCPPAPLSVRACKEGFYCEKNKLKGMNSPLCLCRSPTVSLSLCFTTSLSLSLTLPLPVPNRITDLYYINRQKTTTATNYVHELRPRLLDLYYINIDVMSLCPY